MTFNHSYQDGYFSLIDIAATEERVVCTFQQDIPKMGFLDTSSESEDLKSGSKLELPLWLAKQLSVKKDPIVTCELPKIYTKNYRDVLTADSTVVQLSKWNLYFYEFGMQLSIIPNVELEILSEALLQSFKSRFLYIMDQAYNPQTDSTASSLLPFLERELYAIGRKYNREQINWIERGSKRIEIAEVINIIKVKKRKRAEMKI